MNSIDIIIPLLIGFAMDCLFGDPYWLPHPIRLFGNLISAGERRLNKGNHKKIKGAVLSISLVLITFFVLWLGLNWLANSRIIFLIVSSALVFYGLANRSLIQESVKVISVLNRKGIEAGRKQLSMIVGRDTSKLTENEIRTAVLETLSENLSDGVIAPLFFYFLGGVPAMLAYKMANTLDSMIGYKSDRYKDFGFFAAKFDDLLNFIPARLTSFLMVLVTVSFRGLRYIFKYGRKHSSPNAGYPEAALAGILNCRFGGSNIYHGVYFDKPYIGENEKLLSNRDIYVACLVNLFSTILFISTICAFLYFK